MRNIYPLIILFSMSLVAYACNTTPTGKEAELVGVWAYEKWVLNGEDVPVAALEKPTMSFGDDGSYLLKAGEATRKSSWKLSGDTIIVDGDQGDVHRMIIRSVSKEKLVLESYSEDLKTEITLVPQKETTEAQN